jgi:hypothetical protein
MFDCQLLSSGIEALRCCREPAPFGVLGSVAARCCDDTWLCLKESATGAADKTVEHMKSRRNMPSLRKR